MKPANNEEERVQLAIFCYQLEDSSTRTRLHPIELSPKEVQWKCPITQAVGKTIMVCCSQTDSKAPLTKTIPTQGTERRENELVPMEKTHPHVLCGFGSFQANKRET